MNKLYSFCILVGINFIFSNIVQATNEYYVYSDKFDNGLPSGLMGASNGKSLTIDPSCKEKPYKGENCLKMTASGEESWCGVFIQKGGNWTQTLDPSTPLADLTGKKYFIFSARSDKNYSIAKIGMGEGKELSKEEAGLALTPNWQRYVLELPARDFKRINSLLLVVFDKAGTIFLDEVFYAGEDFAIQSSDIVFKERKEALDPTSFYIYGDKFENGIPSGVMGEKNGISMTFDDNCKNNPYLGTKCIKITTNKSEAWRGIYILYTGAWNAALNENSKLADLSAYDKLEFYAKSDSKDSDPYVINELGVGAGDKVEEKRSETFVEIGPTWKKHTINLKGMNLKGMNSLLFMTLPVGTLYLDEIRFLKKKEK
jgi:hypothetical protein